MSYYTIGFLNKGEIKETVIVRSDSKRRAYEIAETMFKRNNWRFTYTDMYCDKSQF